MSMNEKEWECCRSITITRAWVPSSCPICEMTAARIQREALVFDRDSARMLADERLAKLDRIDYLVSDVRLSEWELRQAIREALQGDGHESK